MTPTEEALVGHLEEAVGWLINLAPPKSHDGPCGPWENCDSLCSDAYYHMLFVEDCRKLITRLKSNKK